MKILITGIDGFVGSHLTEALFEIPNVQIHGLIESGSNLQHILQYRDRLELIECDITNSEAVSRVIKMCKPERIFHLAGQAFVPFSIQDPQQTYRVNINGGINLLEAIRNHAHSAYVLVVSSGEVYGAVDPAKLPIDESFLLNPSNPYAASKASIDIISQQYRKSFGMNVVVARPFNHLGPRQSDLFVGSAFGKQIAEIKLKKHAPKIFVGNLTPKRDFTNVKDVVQAYIKLLDHPMKYGVYNVCTGKSVAISEVLDILCEISGVKVEIIHDSERQRSQDVLDIFGSSQRLQNETGWKPMISLRDTLKSLLDYWEQKLS